LIEKNGEYGKGFLMVFIDCKKAFDSTKSEEIRESFGKNGNCTRSFEKSEKYI
jgi:hypothetical protein